MPDNTELRAAIDCSYPLSYRLYPKYYKLYMGLVPVTKRHQLFFFFYVKCVHYQSKTF